MPRYHADGTVEMKFQSPEYERPVYQDKPAPRPFARSLGYRKEPAPVREVSTKKVTVAAVKPRKPVKPKAEPRQKPPSKKELNKARNQKIVELIKEGATTQQAGAEFGLSSRQALHIFRQHCPDYPLPKGGHQHRQLEAQYGEWEVLDDRRYYRQPDGSMAPKWTAGDSHLKCRCSCKYQPFAFVSTFRLTNGQTRSCIHCATARRFGAIPTGNTGSLTAAELEQARKLAPGQ